MKYVNDPMNNGKTITALFAVRTTYPGADYSSVTYYTELGAAYVQHRRNGNGELFAMVVESDEPLPMFCGDSWSDVEWHGARFLYDSDVTIRKYRVWGAPGHRQRESFCDSFEQDMTSWVIGRPGVRWLQANNADVTMSNAYTDVIIARPTAEECVQEIRGQLSDGLFENSRYGLVEEIDLVTGEATEFHA